MNVLVVDDEERFAALVAEHLREAGHKVTASCRGADAVQKVQEENYDVVITDLRMSPVDGMGVLDAAKKTNPDTEVVLMTAYGTVGKAVAAMRQGAYDFVTKPFSLDELVLLLERIEEHKTLKQENVALRQELQSTERFADMIGSSPALTEVRELIAKVAPTDTSVLILGESGVGKELVARLVHRKSLRSAQSFVVVHAAALPENLLESELFGYEKGAFTGATKNKPGRLEAAERGTLFLDEIGEIPAAFQVKLLRFLQEKTFMRLGGVRQITVDTRIIAATNRNLQDAVAKGMFRQDLYYRLSVFPITVPSLRKRRTDIPSLARYILKRLGYNRPISNNMMRLLENYDWPGNVRELENVLERALILAAGAEIKPQHIQLPEAVLVETNNPKSALLDIEEEMLRKALRRTGGNKSKAAKMLGITRRILYTKLKKFGIEYAEDE